MKRKFFVLFFSFLFLGCIDNQIDFYSYELQNVDFLLITNPTKRDKNNFTTWVKIQENSRAVEDIESNLSEKEIFSLNIEQTLPAKTIDPALLKKKNARSVNDKVKFVSYKEGDSYIFYDYDGSEINAELQYEGEYCYVWQDLDESTTQLTIDELKNFADNFDFIYLKQTALCGP